MKRREGGRDCRREGRRKGKWREGWGVGGKGKEGTGKKERKWG